MEIKNSLKSLKLLLIVIIAALFLFISFSPNAAFAERSLTMEEIILDAQIQPDASMLVTEKIRVDFSGSWEGFFVKIPKGDTPIVDVVVSENGQAYEFNPTSDYGPPGTYLVEDDSNDILIDWSIDANNQVRTFEVSYLVENAVKIHDDVAELYRKFIGEANGNKISHVQVNITLPEGAKKHSQGEDIKIWAHGPLEGEIGFAGPNEIILEMDNLPAYTFIEGRLVMPRELFPIAPDLAYTGQIALASILDEEQGWADKANKERMKAKAKVGTGIGIFVFSLGGVFLLWRKFGKKHETSFDGDYYRELPGNYSPAELSYLWNFKKMQGRDIAATIMDLARRQFLLLEEDTVEVRKFLSSKEKSTYKLSFLIHPEASALKKPEEAILRPHEQNLIDYLQNDIGNGKEYVYLSDIEDYAKKNSEDFHRFWIDWTEDIALVSEKHEFFDENKSLFLFMMIGGLVAIILGFALVAIGGFIGFGLILAGLLFVLTTRFFKRRSVTGEEDYVRWKAFKKFLEHFSEMKSHEIPSLIIWEHYLVYAVILGVAQEVIKQLEIVFSSMQEGDYHFGQTWLIYGSHGGKNSLNNSLIDISNSFERSLKTATQAVSKSSSASGGGGGFSGGGGGGGGGGSYGGR